MAPWGPRLLLVENAGLEEGRPVFGAIVVLGRQVICEGSKEQGDKGSVWELRRQGSVRVAWEPCHPKKATIMRATGGSIPEAHEFSLLDVSC